MTTPRTTLRRIAPALLTALAACAIALLPPAAPAGAGGAGDDIPVFPNADAGADPAVPAEQGGKGFAEVAEKLGYTTNEKFEPIGDAKNAKKGGELVRSVTDYPTNFRPIGPQANTYYNYLSRDLMYEWLVTLHPSTLEWIPNLASHWKKSEDGMTFWYRINPNAKWADGSPVTAEDVVWSWKLRIDETLGSPSDKETYGKFSEVVAESKYIVRVKCAVKNWRNFLYFSTTHIFPAKVISKYPEGKAGDWVKDYNTKFMMGSGPYEMVEEEQQQGKRVTMRRRKDWWALGARQSGGLYNFDRLSHVVITDSALAYERLKKGEKGDINLHLVTTAKRWVVDMRPENVEAMAQGLIQKRKIFNEQPQGVSGIAFNMNQKPYDDVRIRKALALLLPRKRLLKELMYNQYLPLRSYWPGGDYENPKNPRNDYDPRTALALLAEAGYKERNASGQLVNDKGEALTVRLIYRTPGLEKHLTMYQESLKQAGVTMTLELTRPEQLWQQVQEKKYEMANMAWGALLFPNPETSFKSTLAKVPNNNNITGVADEKIDALIARYDTLEIEDQKERVALIREIDGILAEQYPYVLFWYGPYERFIFWNVFGYPEWGLSRTEDDRDVERMWWYDEEKAKKVEAARNDPSIKLEIGETNIKYWREKRERSE